MEFPRIPLILLLVLLPLHSRAIVLNITNNCPYTIWPASVPGGGRRLDPGQVWTLDFPTGPRRAQIWARTNCTFGPNSANGTCLTGDCDGRLECDSYGSTPRTLAEYGLNSFGHRDYYSVSVLEGFNVPVELAPTSNGCARPVRCAADLSGQCPNGLRAPGGCNNPCTVYRTAEYCCHEGPCRPTELSRFFKERCRDAFTYPQDDPTGTFTCPEGTNYRVVFCP
ncbi:Osmotin-like protein OSM34 [Striga hermonthica]|uniref:Osmotin-like protein OSM34 n=1 Tax=Striga hermonthica TaxID=68872 RepID=A0A9N7RIS8_STRHE|nr:Osmotin-like protein OSM34 [Striga hermonthica]